MDSAATHYSPVLHSNRHMFRHTKEHRFQTKRQDTIPQRFSGIKRTALISIIDVQPPMIRVAPILSLYFLLLVVIVSPDFKFHVAVVVNFAPRGSGWSGILGGDLLGRFATTARRNLK